MRVEDRVGTKFNTTLYLSLYYNLTLINQEKCLDFLPDGDCLLKNEDFLRINILILSLLCHFQAALSPYELEGSLEREVILSSLYYPCTVFFQITPSQ
jgi:hypothetical protein